MEKPRLSRAVITGSGLLLLLGACSTIHENNTVGSCDTPDGMLIEATTNPKADDYKKATDPAYLAAHLEDQAEQQQKHDGKLGWDMSLYRNQIVGIGEIACSGSDGHTYLTNTGAQLSVRYGN
jgi:hypothetical protein